MIRPVVMVSGVVAGLGLLAAAVGAQEGAHAHILKVVNPEAASVAELGFLRQALGEAGTAAEYASFAAGGQQRPGDLQAMKTHAGNVLHALDPTRMDNGPGLGFGLVEASRKTIAHVRMAADAPDASESLRTHAGHVVSCVQNTLARALRMLEVTEHIRATVSADEADQLSDELNTLGFQLRNGVDANGDGRVTWQEREGGLYVAQEHMRLLLKGEGIG
ncbi:MAG: hypothetical protein OXU74_05825 [Gemmatimonadota bacterium]|nr:hypothetical protein [Gemmatimonadota bacterium]